MKKSEGTARFGLVLASALVVLGLAACVSSTSGPPQAEPDKGEAASVYYQLAIEYFQVGKYELARDRLISSTELDPKQARTWSMLATTYEQLGIPRLAEESHDQALRAGPQDFYVQNAYAIFLCRQGRYADADKQFERSIGARTNDNPEQMMTNAGVCMAQKPDYVKAEAFFRRAIERRPNYAEALLQMALLKHRTGDNLTARAFLQRFQSSNPPTPGVLYLCVLIETALENDRARLDCSNQLIRDFPNSEESRLVLGNS